MTPAASADAETLETRIEREVDVRFSIPAAVLAARVRERLPGADAARLWLDDLYLATACAEGDEAAWRELERRHFDYVRAFARRFGLREDTAADVAEGVIGDLWRKGSLASYAGRSALRTWLGAIITNAALNARVRERREAAVMSATPAGPAIAPADLPARFLTVHLATAVREALARLPAGDRLLVRLYYGDGLTLDEIGAIEGVSKATLSRALKRIREALRADLERTLAARGVSWSDARGAIGSAGLDLDLGALMGEERNSPTAPLSKG